VVDPRAVPVSATGLLAEFARAGVLGASAVHLAQTLGLASGETDQRVLLAAALCLRHQDTGSVCLPLDQARASVTVLETPDDDGPGDVPGATDTSGLPWPPIDEWLDAVGGSRLVHTGTQAPANERPLRLVGTNLYLERNWRTEEQVRIGLLERLALVPPLLPAELVDAAVEAAFHPLERDAGSVDGPERSIEQRQAVRTAATTWTSVIAGGPGTGKTTTVAQLLRVLDSLASGPTTVALAANTGKAATRMQQSLDNSLTGTGNPHEHWRNLRVDRARTLHSLLGAVPGNGFRRNAGNPMPYDVVIVDEMSMVSLGLMAALLAALPATARLVLVGDPDQLASVEAGAVLADIVAAGLPAGPGEATSAITVLRYNHRSSGAIQRLATAIRDGDPDAALALLDEQPDGLRFVDRDPDPTLLSGGSDLGAELVRQAASIRTAALAGDAATALSVLDDHRLLCAHRAGRYGVSQWSRAVAQILRHDVPGYGRDGEWYAGRPILVTRNAPDVGIANGDTGVVMLGGDHAQVALPDGDRPRLRSPWLLDSVETMHALTVHKSQGSEYGTVTVVLPPPSSPLLSRELLYTAVTRARHRVRILGTRESVVKAIGTPAHRATGLGERLGSS